VTLGQQEADTGGEEDTLLHGETLLVVASGDTENVALELVAESVDGDLSGDALVVKDATILLNFLKAFVNRSRFRRDVIDPMLPSCRLC